MMIGDRQQFLPTSRQVLVGLIALGWLLCILHYLARPSFWHDEAFLVLNVLDKTSAELMGTLDHEQAAPPLYLLSLRACYVALGSSEFSLRLPSLIFGLATLPVFGWLAWRTLGGWLAVWATGLMALSNELIFQSGTVKQYSGDVLVACVLLALSISPGPSPPRRLAIRFLIISFVAAVAAWVSHPTVFIFGGVSLAMLGGMWSTGRRSRAIWLAGNALVVASFTLLYFHSIRLQHDPQLYQYWIDRGSFPDYARPWMLPVWVVDQVISLCNYPFEPMGGIVLGLAIAGGIGLRTDRQWKLLVITLVPISLTLLAAASLQFPFGGSRVTLFLTPCVVLLAARGIGTIARLAPIVSERKATGDPRLRWFWLAPATLAVWCAGLAGYHVMFPRIKSHMRPAVAFVREHRQPDEAIYILGESRDDEFFSYWRWPDPPVRASVDRIAEPPLPGETFWIVTGFNPRQGFPKNMKPLLEYCDAHIITDRYFGIGGAAFRVEPRMPLSTGDSCTCVK